MTIIEQAQAIREAMDAAGAILTEEQALICARIYPQWEPGKTYKYGERVAYGTNAVGDPQIYNVVQAHTSQNDWLPNHTPSLYAPIGLDDSGYPVWAKPTGAHDAYNKGDIVNYNGILYQSLIDGNGYSPDEYPAGWTIYG